MNQTNDIERLLDRWLADGPSETPDRVIETVADRIERQPQRPAWRLLWREINVNGYLRPLLAGAAAVLIVIAGVVLLRPTGESAGGAAVPSPSPTTSATLAPLVHCDGLTSGCEGKLPAGVHSIPGYPFGYPITFTLPDGWQNTFNSEYDYVLAAPGTEADSTTGGWLRFAQRPYAAAQDATCSPARDPKVSTGSTVLIPWVRSHPGLVATEPKAVTVAGYSGQELDISIAPGWKMTCPGSAVPAVMLFTNVQTADGERYWGLTGPQKARLIFLETAAGTMLIIADASDAAGFDALLSQATPIVESVKLPAH